MNVDGGLGLALAAAFTAAVAAVLVYGIRTTTGAAPRPASPEGKHIERAVTIATVVQLAASFAAPAIVVAAGRSDWLLPSIAVTIGPLLLWLDHRVDVPRYRPAGWALIAGPLLLIAIMSGSALAATTGIASGAILLAIASAGFHDLEHATATTTLQFPAGDAQRLLDAVPNVPTPVWGRDEFGTGEMWNSNSVTSWLLHQARIDTSQLAPPNEGRAPGWNAGLVVARAASTLSNSASAELGSVLRR